MKKSFLIILLGFTFSQCTESSVEKEPLTEVEIDETQFLPLEERAKRHAEHELSIPTTEKYKIKIYKSQLNNDDKEDAIITVNRLDYALKEAAKSENPAQRADIEFMGSYNYYFMYDGAQNKLSKLIPVPSTPQKELKISFENITSPIYKDFIIEFRIRNSCFLDFYTIENGGAQRIFYWKKFDGLGDKINESYNISYKDGSFTGRKDILIHKSKFKSLPEKIDPLTFDPEIEASKKVDYLFFYHPQAKKYMTKK